MLYNYIIIANIVLLALLLFKISKSYKKICLNKPAT